MQAKCNHCSITVVLHYITALLHLTALLQSLLHYNSFILWGKRFGLRSNVIAYLREFTGEFKDHANGNCILLYSMQM